MSSAPRVHEMGQGVLARCIDPGGPSDDDLIELTANGDGQLTLAPTVLSSSVGDIPALSVTSTVGRFVAVATPIVGGSICHAPTSTSTAYFGGPAVTITTGFPLAPGASLSLTGLGDLSGIYFICQSGHTAELRCAPLLAP